MEYFLKEDIEALDRKIEDTNRMVEKALREAGESCQTGHETWHDNPGYEEGRRMATMWSNRLRQLLSIRQNATVIPPAPTPSPDGKIGIGHLVTIRDLASGEERTFRLGSAMVFDETGSRVSYKSPIGQLLFGAMIGDVLESIIGDRKKKILVQGVK